MTTAQKLLAEICEQEVAKNVGRFHEAARAGFDMPGPVTDFESFIECAGSYIAFHITTCVAPGAQLPRFEACERAKQIIVDEYKSRGLTLANACDDAVNCTNGGIRRILDLLCDSLKAQSTAYYVEHVFDALVPPNDWSAKVAVMRELLENIQPLLSRDDRTVRAEQLAHDHKRFFRIVADAQRRVEQQAYRQ